MNSDDTISRLKIYEFLDKYTGMELVPESLGEIVLIGRFEFSATCDFSSPPETFADGFDLKLNVPYNYPVSPIEVYELNQKILHSNGDFHIYTNGRLCLGSELSYALKRHENQTIFDFVDNILVPYLFGFLYKIKHNRYPFGELRHGYDGILDDYRMLFGLKNNEQVSNMLELLKYDKNMAMECACPCRCGGVMRQCKLAEIYGQVKDILPIDFKEHADKLQKYIKMRNGLLDSTAMNASNPIVEKNTIGGLLKKYN